MLEITQLPATRTTLLQLRRELVQVRHGYDLLERKREVLLRELWGLYREVEHIEKQVRERFDVAYGVQRDAQLVLGTVGMRWAGLCPASRTNYSARVRNVMGVALPVVDLTVEPLPLPYSPAGVSTAFDHVCKAWVSVGGLLGSWIQALGSLSLVTSELARTQRRVSGLKNHVIPRYEAGVARIQALLEEQEREAFVHSKRAKPCRDR